MSHISAARNGDAVTNGEISSDIEPWNESAQLNETETRQCPAFRENQDLHRAANSLATARRTVRLLWIGLLVSLAANIFVPVYVISIMKRPEKVALLDGTESLIIAPLVPPEESREIIETLSIWAAKAYLDRGPQGFDMPETLARVFLPQAAKRANEEFKTVAEECAKKNIHQKVEIGRIDLQHLQNGVIVSRVVGQLLTRAQVGDEEISEPQPITLDLKLVRNPYLGRNQRYPYAVQDYYFGKPEQLSLQKQTR
ncbi:MAG: hypothetical protein JO076_03470 [Verrucomicrobia bacterium]|nr:hypothetical protein [Verrucomicrobiota bacterium]